MSVKAGDTAVEVARYIGSVQRLDSAARFNGLINKTIFLLVNSSELDRFRYIYKYHKYRCSSSFFLSGNARVHNCIFFSQKSCFIMENSGAN